MVKGTVFVARLCLKCVEEFPEKTSHFQVVNKDNPVCPIHGIKLIETQLDSNRGLRRGWTKEPISQFIDIGEQTMNVGANQPQCLPEVQGDSDEDY